MKILSSIRLPLDGQPESQGVPTSNLACNQRRIANATNSFSLRIFLLRSLVTIAVALCAAQVYAEGPMAPMAPMAPAPKAPAPTGPAQSQIKLAPIQLSQERSQAIGVTYATVEEKALVDRIDATGFIEPDEQLEGYVQTRFAGWVRRVYADQTFQYVTRGQPLFTIYSPDLVSAENEYLIALRDSLTLQDSKVEGVAAGAHSLTAAALDRLGLFGVSPREIKRLERQGTARQEIEIDAPMSGYIIDRKAFPNLYAQPDTRLYTITNLSTVWVYAAVFQNQLSEVKVGDKVEVSVDSYPGKVFRGNVDFIWQTLDTMTRTAKVRCALPNPQGLLKLGMFVRAALKPNLGRALVVPDSAVFRTGLNNVVFVDRGDGYLEPRFVQLGPDVGDEFTVESGLKAGERIVNSANFLIDSESQLQAALGTFAPPPPGASGSAGSAQSATVQMTTDPNPPRKGSNRVVVTLRDSSGKPIAGADVSVVFFMPAMPAMGMSAMRSSAKVTDQGNGSYAASLKLDTGGTWQVALSASKGGKQLASRQLAVSATGGM